MKQPRTKLAALLAAAAVTIALAGCGAKESLDSGSGGASPSPSPTAVASTSPSPSPSPQVGEGAGEGTTVGNGSQTDKTKLEIIIYQTDSELTALKELKTEISFTNEQDKLRAALQALAGGDREGNQSLWQGVTFNSVKVLDGAATVDMTIPDESRLGGPGEELALEAMAKTAFQFKEIQSLDLLVDGKAVDSLMGHVELDHPILRSAYEATK
ncbi:Sporulation and spore germination [Paenibacillaceae bacterium GAS479]|nr:Sporulation and spore germination [Paenibacillaceae bacterium GAS479]